MAVFLDIVLSFPTVAFSLLLCLVTLYWLMVVLGAMDIEALDFGDGLIDGALDGLDGALDGAFDGAVDGAFDGAVDGALDGAMDGAAEAAVDGAADGAGDGAADAAAASGGFSMLMFFANIFRLGRVPVTVSLTSFAIWGWLMGFLLTWVYQQAPGIVPHTVFSVVSMVAVLGIAAGLTNVSVRPLEPIFKTEGARERSSLVGEVCEVTTGRVDDEFGQATAQIGTDDLIFQVRCDDANRLRRGDTALIVSYDPRREAYVIEPMADVRTAQGHAIPAAALSNPALVNKEA